MLLGRVAAIASGTSAGTPSACRTAAQRRFLAKGVTKGKKPGGQQPAGARGGGGRAKAGSTKKAATEQGNASAKAKDIATPAASAAATTTAGGVTPNTAAATASTTSGGGFTKSEMLAARQARKASAAKSSAAAAATAATKAAEAARLGKGAGAGVGVGAGVGAGGAKSGGGGKWGWGSKALAGSATGIAILGVAWQLKPDEVRRLLDDSPIDHLAVWAMGKYQLYSSPVKDKLLPDFPVPPGAPTPPVLVLDLEGTLLGTIYTRKNGWRVAKRPGLDEFLKEMAQLYEIVVFTDSFGGLAEEWITKMDPDNMYISHRLYRDGTRFVDGKYVKDLTSLNRPLEQLVIVDDNDDCISMQPENALKVPMFSLEEGSDPTADTVLYELAPFLRALAMQGVADYRNVLRPHIGEDYSAVVSDFRSKVNAVLHKEETERARGLGGLVRQIAPAVGSSGLSAGGMMTSKDIVGDAPDKLSPAMAAAVAAAGGGGGKGGGGTGVTPLKQEKKGGLWRSLDEGAKEREEDFIRKNEAFQRVMMKREEREKARREQAARG